MMIKGVSDAQVADLIEKAADAWESGAIGWCRGRFADRRVPETATRVCSWGGLMRAAHGQADATVRDWLEARHEPVVLRALSAIEDHLSASGRDHGGSLATWNDFLAKDEQHVIEVFKETAKDLRNQS